jgi:outer membrane beta-barrel protein
MTMTNSTHRRFAVVASSVAALLVTVLPLVAQAQRKSPLEDAPAIRKRVELRETRLEAGAGFGSTVNQDFYHTLMVDLKLGFHFTDWLSLSVMGALAVDNLATGFQDRLMETLPGMNPTVPREPTQTGAKASMSKINNVVAAQVEFTPFTGKYSLFGKIFAHYDFYVFGGVGALNIKPTDQTQPACNSTNATTSCGVSGFKPGGNAGVGLHTFFNQWLALGVELRDIVAQINPSGRDVNGDGNANSSDLSWGSTFMVTGNLTVYLPSAAVISQ